MSWAPRFRRVRITPARQEMTVEELRAQVRELAHVVKVQQDTIDVAIKSIERLLGITKVLVAKVREVDEKVQ